MGKQLCNPCIIEVIKPYSRNAETLIIRQEQKKSKAKIKLTTYAKGETKNSFIDDCQKRGLTESEVARQIVKLYYELINSRPQLKGKEFKEIKAYFISL